MSRDDFENETLHELARRHKHTTRKFDKALADRLLRKAGELPPLRCWSVERTWMLLWEIHARHPTLVCIAMTRLLRDSPIHIRNPVVIAVLNGLHRAAGHRKSDVVNWLPRVMEHASVVWIDPV